MKPIFIILLSLLLTSCLKANVAPVPPVQTTQNKKADSLTNNTIASNVASANTYDWFNGTKGEATIKVTCNDCSAIATIGDATVPFLFNEQGIGMLKYTPASGLAIRIAVCPGTVKAVKAEIFDAAGAPLYGYSGIVGNWNDTYILK